MPRQIPYAAIVAVLTQLACSPPPPPSAPVVVDGSSTLEPLTTAIAQAFAGAHPSMPVTLAAAGTGEGFTRFCRGEVDVAAASRPVRPSEQERCQVGGVRFIELPVGFDALTVIVNAGNTWASSITTDDLRRLWEPAAEKKVTTWKAVRAEWPDRPIRLFAPGAESGTFDYFTETINGVADSSRGDYTASADDTVIVNGVGADVEALGYVGYSHFDRNRTTLKALAVDDASDGGRRGAIEPSPEAVGRGMYHPFARPVFIYVNQGRLTRPEVRAFVDTYLRRAGELAPASGIVPLLASTYTLAANRLSRNITGTMFKTPEDVKAGVNLMLAEQDQ